MSGGRSVALQQLHNAYHQQDRGPGSVELDHVEALEQEEYPDRNQYGRTDDLTHAASITGASDAPTGDQPPLPREHPSPEENQEERPEAVEAKFEDVHGVQQEEHTQSNQDDRDRRNIFVFATFPHTKGLCQAVGIGRGFAHLKRPGCAYGIDDLVDVEKRDTDAEDPVPTSGMI